MADIVTISVSMPAEMQRLIMERIKARFFGNISEYFRHLVRQDLEQPGGPLSSNTGAVEAAKQPKPSNSGESPKGLREPVQRPDLHETLPLASSRAREELRDEDVATLRKQFPPAKIERLLKTAKPGSAEAKRLEGLLRVLRGEGTPKQRYLWWDPMDIDFFDLLRFRMDTFGGSNDDGLGGSPVNSPRSPKPKPDSARAKRPRTED